MLRSLAVPFILLLQMLDVRAEQPQFEDRVGDAYEIRLGERVRDIQRLVSGSSHSARTLMERVVALHDGGIELEFDLPEQASPQVAPHLAVSGARSQVAGAPAPIA